MQAKRVSGSALSEGTYMDKRVEKLEASMADIQVRLIRVESKLDAASSKADLSELAVNIHRSMNEQTWKFLGAAVGMSALFASIAFGLTHALK